MDVFYQKIFIVFDVCDVHFYCYKLSIKSLCTIITNAVGALLGTVNKHYHYLQAVLVKI